MQTSVSWAPRHSIASCVRNVPTGGEMELFPSIMGILLQLEYPQHLSVRTELLMRMYHVDAQKASNSHS